MSRLSINYQETGTPVVFSISAPLPPVGKTIMSRGNIPVANWHHGAMGEKNLLAGDSRMRAIRLCAMQWVRTDDHWGVFHKLDLLPAIPVHEDKSFVYVAMQRAKYVGEYGLKFDSSSGHPVARNRLLSHGHRRELWSRGYLSCESPFASAKYLAERIVQEGLSSLSYKQSAFESYIAEPAKHENSLLLLAASLVSRSTNFGQIFTSAQKHGHLPPGTRSDPAEFLMSTILPTHNDSLINTEIVKNTRAILSAAVLGDGSRVRMAS